MAPRVMVYSHDTFGLGNIRRMLAVAQHLLDSHSASSVLVVTGSPMVHEFRIRPGLDYIKLPCLSRTGPDQYAAKSLATNIDSLMRLRASMILAAARDFAPDVVLVDKKPDGIKHELRPTLEHLRRKRPACQLALVLRDILDAPEATIPAWSARGYNRTLRTYFDSILILGTADIFDAPREYRFPEEIRARSRFCGYVRRARPDEGVVAALRARLLARGQRRLVLVTPGGGEDGHALVTAYARGLGRDPGVRSVIFCGPEMPAAEREAIRAMIAGNPGATAEEFTGEMVNYMAASDVVVSMAGYNTTCEILSLNKRAVVAPRVHPVSEQWIRAERMAKLGLLSLIHPRDLSPEGLAGQVRGQLEAGGPPPALPTVQLDGLANIGRWVRSTVTEEHKQPAMARLMERSLECPAALPTF